jgi:hypothetical protein
VLHASASSTTGRRSRRYAIRAGRDVVTVSPQEGLARGTVVLANAAPTIVQIEIVVEDGSTQSGATIRADRDQPTPFEVWVPRQWL